MVQMTQNTMTELLLTEPKRKNDSGKTQKLVGLGNQPLRVSFFLCPLDLNWGSKLILEMSLSRIFIQDSGYLGQARIVPFVSPLLKGFIRILYSIEN